MPFDPWANEFERPATKPSVPEEPFQLFVETQAFALADIPTQQWIPFLPIPGTYEHPVYGKIEITKAANTQMVDSVKSHVYQEAIPLDAEHETKLSGAIAWIRDMRMNADDSADAFVEWTDRGRSLLGAGQFKYVSPEWFRTWRDPATGTIHENVIVGGAITTRPFFKDKVLRALVASETGAQIIGGEEATAGSEGATVKKCTSCGESFEGSGDTCQACANKMAEPTPAPAPAAAAEPAKATEPQAKSYTASEVDAKILEATKTFAERITAAETLAATEKTARETLQTELDAIKVERRTAKFTELVLDHAGGNQWFGEPGKHVAMLESLTQAFGEDSQQVKDYIEQQQGVASSIRSSELFKEIGSSATGTGSDPERKLEEMAKTLQASENITYELAYDRVTRTPEGIKLFRESLKG